MTNLLIFGIFCVIVLFVFLMMHQDDQNHDVNESINKGIVVHKFTRRTVASAFPPMVSFTYYFIVISDGKNHEEIKVSERLYNEVKEGQFFWHEKVNP